MKTSNSSEGVFLASVTDLMTSLAVIFILLLISFVMDAQAKEADLRKTIEKSSEIQKVMVLNQELKKQLAQALAEKGYVTSDHPTDILALVFKAQGNNLQFEYNSADLQLPGQSYLRKFLRTLLEVLKREPFRENVEQIIVEGHTDSIADDEYNLELSQRRALEVLKFGLQNCGLSRSDREYFLDLTSVNGRGERGLLPPHSLAGGEDPEASRRVEFVIRFQSFENKVKNQSDHAEIKLNDENVMAGVTPAVPGRAVEHGI